MPLPTVYRKSAEPSIASYSYTDIAEGTGVQQFYLCSSEIVGTVNDYHLVENVIYSDALTLAFNDGVSQDFDLTAFNMPKVIKGTGILQIAHRQAGAGGTAWGSVVLKKYSGTTETTIVGVISPTITAAVEGVWNMPITIPQTHFKRGDILRLTISGANTDTGMLTIGFDPQNRASAGVMTITQSSIFIPFKLDL